MAPPASMAAQAPQKPVVEQIRERRRASSSIGANLLLLLAIVLVFLVFMYKWNQGRPKESTMFGGGEPMAAAAPPPAAPAAPSTTGEAAAPAAAGADKTIRGKVELGPGLSSPSPQAALFVLLRAAGSPDRGPPVAVKRYQAASLPLDFEIGPQDAMMGGPFEGPFDLYVRLDSDGNAMTKESGDLELGAPKAGVAAGTGALSVVLDRRR